VDIHLGDKVETWPEDKGKPCIYYFQVKVKEDGKGRERHEENEKDESYFLLSENIDECNAWFGYLKLQYDRARRKILRRPDHFVDGKLKVEGERAGKNISIHQIVYSCKSKGITVKNNSDPFFLLIFLLVRQNGRG